MSIVWYPNLLKKISSNGLIIKLFLDLLLSSELANLKTWIGIFIKVRRFVIQYFCNDDSLLVYEPPRRNSGIVEGKFLERGKYSNPSTGEFYKNSDFGDGKVVRINGYEYEILKTDDFSDKWQKDHGCQ